LAIVIEKGFLNDGLGAFFGNGIRGENKIRSLYLRLVAQQAPSIECDYSNFHSSFYSSQLSNCICYIAIYFVALFCRMTKYILIFSSHYFFSILFLSNSLVGDV